LYSEKDEKTLALVSFNIVKRGKISDFYQLFSDMYGLLKKVPPIFTEIYQKFTMPNCKNNVLFNITDFYCSDIKIF